MKISQKVDLPFDKTEQLRLIKRPANSLAGYETAV
jgi:hypothetical protein